MEIAISPSTPKFDWRQIIAILSPAILFALLVVTPRTRASATDFLADNWGNIASVWGLGLSVYVLWVAKGAKGAAEEATREAQEAAAAARSAAQTRSALEELQDAAAKTTQIGLFARAQKWDLASLTAQEVMNICRVTVARWGEDQIFKDSRTRLLSAISQMQTIVQESNDPDVNLQSVLDAQLTASDKLSFALGKIRRGQDLGSL